MKKGHGRREMKEIDLLIKPFQELFIANTQRDNMDFLLALN